MKTAAGKLIERGHVLTEADVWVPPGGWGLRLQRAGHLLYQAEVFGPSAVGRAVNAVLAREGPERFALAEYEGGHGKGSPGPVVDVVRGFGLATLAGVACIRWLGENDDPEGAGSLATVASWYGADASDPAIVAATIAVALWAEQERRPGWSGGIYRLRKP